MHPRHGWTLVSIVVANAADRIHRGVTSVAHHPERVREVVTSEAVRNFTVAFPERLSPRACLPLVWTKEVFLLNNDGGVHNGECLENRRCGQPCNATNNSVGGSN